MRATKTTRRCITLSVLATILFRIIYMPNNNDNNTSYIETSSLAEQNDGVMPPPENCTAAELSIIKQQLPPDDCRKYAGQPWMQQCSMSYATRCGFWYCHHFLQMLTVTLTLVELIFISTLQKQIFFLSHHRSRSGMAQQILHKITIRRKAC